MIQLKNAFKLVLLFCIGLTFFACESMRSHNSIPKDIFIKRLEVEVAFRGNINYQNYNYFLVFSNSGEPFYPEKTNYFILPGQFYNNEALAEATEEGLIYYYQNFLYTWSDYIKYLAVPELFNSGGNFNADTNEDSHYSYARNIDFNPDNESASNKIILKFSIEDLSNVTENIYFTVVVTRKSDDILSNDILVESLDELYTEIRNEIGPEVTGTDLTNSEIEAAADVISWRLKVF